MPHANKGPKTDQPKVANQPTPAHFARKCESAFVHPCCFSALAQGWFGITMAVLVKRLKRSCWCSAATGHHAACLHFSLNSSRRRELDDPARVWLVSAPAACVSYIIGRAFRVALARLSSFALAQPALFGLHAARRC